MEKIRRKDTLRRIMKYISRYRFTAAMSIVFAVCNVVAALYVPILVGRAIDCIVYRQTDYTRLLGILLMAVLSTLASALSLWCMNELNNRLTFNIVRDIRNEAFLKIHSLPF